MKKLINKKIKNATKVVYKNITFDSKLELYAYKALEESGLTFTYQKKSVLQKSYNLGFDEIKLIDFKKRTTNVLKPITYTIDFVVEGKNGYDYFIETKGFKTNEFKIKFKMFICEIVPMKSMVFLASNQKQVQETIKIIKQYENSNNRL